MKYSERKMDSLEKQIRIILRHRVEEEYFKMLSQTTLQDSVRDKLKEYTFKTGFVDDNEALVDSAMEKAFAPEYMRQTAHKSAQQMYLTREEARQKIEETYGNLKPLAEDEIFEELKSVTEEYLMSEQSQQSALINGLVKIAKTEGLEKALSEDSESEVFRQIYPTADDYMNEIQSFINKTDEFIKKQKSLLIKALKISSESQEATMIDVSYTMLESISKNFLGTYFGNKAKDIYGESPKA